MSKIDEKKKITQCYVCDKIKLCVLDVFYKCEDPDCYNELDYFRGKLEDLGNQLDYIQCRIDDLLDKFKGKLDNLIKQTKSKKNIKEFKGICCECHEFKYCDKLYKDNEGDNVCSDCFTDHFFMKHVIPPP
jgi:hypothetical protein